MGKELYSSTHESREDGSQSATWNSPVTFVSQTHQNTWPESINKHYLMWLWIIDWQMSTASRPRLLCFISNVRTSWNWNKTKLLTVGWNETDDHRPFWFIIFHVYFTMCEGLNSERIFEKWPTTAKIMNESRVASYWHVFFFDSV